MSDENIPSETDHAEQEAVLDSAEKMKELEAEVAGLKDRLLRQTAETENVRRRLEREKTDATAYAVTSFARDLLAVADNLRRALDSIPPAVRETKGVETIVSGVEMTERELKNVLQRHGIVPVDALGQKLDPNLHQPMFEVETADQEPGIIVQELQTGYRIKDRLLRPALVGVAKAPAAQAAEPAESESGPAGA
jgi:molecular chaperone GrpE